MAKSRLAPAPAPPAVTVDRAARLCRLLQLVGTRAQTRSFLLERLQLDMRGFYRDLKLLREVGISVLLSNGKYRLKGENGVIAALERLPFPDPHLTLGEARILCKGRSSVHRKLQELLRQILPK